MAKKNHEKKVSIVEEVDQTQICDECDRPAVYCVQTICRIYPYDGKTGEYGEPFEPDDQTPDADWYCAKCAEEAGLLE